MPWRLLIPDYLGVPLMAPELQLRIWGHGKPLRFFMTGDGHRKPPFQWTEKTPLLKQHFERLMKSRKLCVHVELQQADVGKDPAATVPGYLMDLISQGRVFGWEIDLYSGLGTILFEFERLARNLAEGPPLSTLAVALRAEAICERVRDIERRLNNSSDHRVVEHLRQRKLDQGEKSPTLLDIFTEASAKASRYKAQYGDLLRARGAAHEPRSLDHEYAKFLLHYRIAVMGMRTAVHPLIGDKIQRVIADHPGCTHLISCGDAHINENPLYRYIKIPDDEWGVADPGRFDA